MSEQKIRENRERYYKENRNNILKQKREYNKKFYELNKDMILEYKNTKISCECGDQITRRNLSRHQKSQNHIQKLQYIEDLKKQNVKAQNQIIVDDDTKVKQSNYMVFDIETTGFATTKSFNNYYDYKDTSKYDNARVVQVAYRVYDSDGNKISVCNKIIKPDGFKIPKKMIHGITHKHALNDGVTFKKFFKKFKKDLDNVETIVCHNVPFDRNVFLAELYRHGKIKTAKIVYVDQIYVIDVVIDGVVAFVNFLFLFYFLI